MAFRLDILRTPRASVTVVTIGSPSGMAATASDTALVQSERTWMRLGTELLTSNGEHLQPRAALQDTNHTDHSDYSEGEYGELLGKFVHSQLQRSTFFLHL